jgi:hypothetical protein
MDWSSVARSPPLTSAMSSSTPHQGQAEIEVVADNGDLIASGRPQRTGDYSPITELVLNGGEIRRREVWPTDEHLGLAVLLPGGEVGVLTAWRNAEDHSWWQWSVEFSNHRERPATGSQKTAGCAAGGEWRPVRELGKLGCPSGRAVDLPQSPEASRWPSMGSD